jgi:hypothetical protein
VRIPARRRMIVHNGKTWSWSSTLSVPVDMEERKPQKRLGYQLIADWPAFILLKYISLKYISSCSPERRNRVSACSPGILSFLLARCHSRRRWPSISCRRHGRASKSRTAPRISFGIGLACKLRKRTAEARMHLEHRRLLAKIEAALTEL